MSTVTEDYPGELDMLRSLIRTLRAVIQEDRSAEKQRAEVRRLLHHHTADDTAARANATPGLNDRQARLLDAIRTHGGAWTTRRVLHLYALTDPDVVQRGKARRDLNTLCRAGHLVLVDEPDNRHYTLSTRKDGAR